MEFVAILAGIAGLVLVYFFIGILLKLLWEWWPAALGVLIFLPLGFSGGWGRAALGILGLLGTLAATQGWQNTRIHDTVVAVINEAFHFKDT